VKKYRYEYPPREAHFIESPTPEAATLYLKRTYPHNYDDVLPTLVEIPKWPSFWKIIDEHGRLRPPRDQ